MTDSFDYSNMTIYRNISAHSTQFIDIPKTAVPYIFCQNTGPLCQTKQSSHLRLHIGRKSGMRSCFYIDFLKRRYIFYPNTVIIFRNFHSHFNKLGRN